MKYNIKCLNINGYIRPLTAVIYREKGIEAAKEIHKIDSNTKP